MIATSRATSVFFPAFPNCSMLYVPTRSAVEDAHLQRGFAYRELQHSARALQDLGRVTELDGDRTLGHCHRAAVLFERRRYDRAIAISTARPA